MGDVLYNVEVGSDGMSFSPAAQTGCEPILLETILW
jgi:hypothetical protein